jgi:hypothetical protein
LYWQLVTSKISFFPVTLGIRIISSWEQRSTGIWLQLGPNSAPPPHLRRTLLYKHIVEQRIAGLFFRQSAPPVEGGRFAPSAFCSLSAHASRATKSIFDRMMVAAAAFHSDNEPPKTLMVIFPPSSLWQFECLLRQLGIQFPFTVRFGGA